MANFILCSILFRIVMPAIMLTCVVFRPCAISGVYLLLLLISASVPVPTVITLAGCTGLYLKILIMISTLATFAQFIFQILLLLKFKPYGSILKNCELLERIMRHVGFVKLDGMDAVTAITWITPEVIMFLSSIVFYVVFKKFTKPAPIEEEGLSKSEEETIPGKKTGLKVFVSLGKYFVIVALCLAAVLKPSVVGGFYFLIFLCAATWWACDKTLEKGFAVLLKFCMIVVCCHLFTLYTYQTDWAQEYLESNSTYARYLGISKLMTTDMTTGCKDPRVFIYESQPWTDYVLIAALLFLYFSLAIESSQLLQPKPPKKQGTFSRLEGSFKGHLSRQLSQRLSERRLRRSGTSRNRWQNATRKVRVSEKLSKEATLSESAPLIHGVATSTHSYGSNLRGPAVLQDSSGSGIENVDNIPLKQVSQDQNEDEIPLTCIEQLLFILESILLFIIKTSYIGTNIIMMAWSITYHSWLTFVLLLWSSMLWMVPNQRKHMLRSSPFLVIYAWFLLISAYIYSMDLTESELPSTIDGIDLAQIGFIKMKGISFKMLLTKCLYTVMFWITLRQYMKERKERQQDSVLSDMIAPLQISVGAAAGLDQLCQLVPDGQKYKKKVYPEKFNDPPPYVNVNSNVIQDSKPTSSGMGTEEGKDTRVMAKVGKFFSRLLMKFWIWIVAITLFLVAITGERMTSFRILYMALFLIFILSFQLSFRVWRKMMFSFWLTVIIYSMLILVMVYTYQFNHFPEYWEKYLHVSEQQQLDIGLEKYETKQLFVRLVTPTFFVIIAVVQLHYFHKDFMEMSKPGNRSVIDTTKSEANSSAQGGMKFDSDEDEQQEPEDKESVLDLTDIDNVSSKVVRKKIQMVMHKLYDVFNLMMLFLELHLPKLVLFIAMLVCVKDVCAISLIIVVLIVLGATIGKSVQRISIYASSLIASLLLLTRMVYQIKYIEHDIWNVTCEIDANKTEVNVTRNSAEWLGLDKIENGRDLPKLVRWNIVLIVVVTFWCIVNVRQSTMRTRQGHSADRPFFMFPKVRVSDADKNLKTYLMYLANYFFYRMGVEVCLIAIVATIGIRMDLYALLYGIWLCILFSLQRKTLSKVWDVFLIFTAIVIPIQYIMVIGLPPSLCINFPWDSSEILRNLQDWAFLMDPISPPPAKKLLCDFTLLLLVARQSLVFRIEKRYASREYAGGSNESIIHHAENTDFVNPVPDFVTYSRTYLDVIKRSLLLPFMWITLAIVFLAGTNRVNLFSIGYLIGSFYFLWEGSDIYLRPINKILEKWNVLLGYNVVVILLKIILQLIGCLFFDYMKADACWVIQLFGISCLRKFKVVKFMSPLQPDECAVPREFIGLAWDGACFACLLLQRRLFQSYNFFHIVNESKASAILASRGAELIEELREKRMMEQDEQERKIIEKIKMKMDRIKATQQKVLGPDYQEQPDHYTDQPPLARSPSMTSCTSGTSGTSQPTPAGYHTPIDEEGDGDPAPLTPATGSQLQTNAPSPFSAILTGSLEAYLEPNRMSFSSPPNSEINPRPPSPDDSFPVFSPPPYDDAPPYAEAVSEQTTVVQRQTSIGPPWMNSLVTPRQSVISYSSRSPMSHHTYSIFGKSSRPLYRRKEPKHNKAAIRSGDYYMFDDLDDEGIDIFEDTKSDDEEEEGALRRRPKKRTLSELLSTTLKTDVSTVLRTPSDYPVRRRVSLPPRKGESAESQMSVPYSAPPTVPIQEEGSKLEPKPSTSKAIEEDKSSMHSSKKPPSKFQKIMDAILFALTFIESFMLSGTNYLNRYSKDHRYVIRVLSKEKKLLKETTDYNVGARSSPNNIWQPSGSYKTLLLQSREGSMLVSPSIGTHTPDSYKLGLYGQFSRMADLNSSNSDRSQEVDYSDKKEQPATSLPYSAERERRKASVLTSTIPEIRILAPSMERGLNSPTGSGGQQVNFMDEYEENEMSSYDQPTILRLILAMWYIVLSHSDMLCYFIIFLNQVKNATFISLPLPLMVFFWGTLTVPRPSKTFWVTIIAYTQIIVLIKCMFQFQILPWNQGDSYPFDATSIIGIERKKNYAVWDLLLLLVVYFHRYMLKCLGLWKTSVTPMAVLAEGVYNIDENGELKSLHSSIEHSIKNKVDKDGDLEKLVDDSDMDPDKVYLQSGEIPPKQLLPLSAKLMAEKYVESIKEFFQQLFDPTSRVAADVYSYMFLCDFFNFFVILLGYSSFGSQQGDVSSYLEDNRVPGLFLLMLILQFLIIIVDRAIFLRKNIFAKIVFQFLQIFSLHIWLFMLFPIITERSVNSVLPPQMYYMVKCFYLLLSAYQIRCGYPARILGNVLCKGYGYINMFLYKAFMLVPFLFELRTVMDWMWTDTSMTVFDWIKMEDIFSHIYQLKCSRYIEDEYPQPRGEKKKPSAKYIMGGFLLIVIIGTIWFPLVFFSLGNAVGEPNLPYDVTIDLRLGPYEPLYRMSAQSNSIFQFSENDYTILQSRYIKNKAASTFISNYEYADIAAVKLSFDSATVWSISPPDQERMIEEVASNNTLIVHMQYQVSHASNTKEDTGVMRYEVELEIDAFIDNKPNPIRANLLNMLNTTQNSNPILLNYMMPKFAKVTSRGTTQVITQLMEPYPDMKANSLRNITLKISSELGKVWWDIKEQCDDYNYKTYLQYLPYADCSYFIMYTFNDKIFPATLNMITGGGIIGLYTTLVFVASRVLRGFFSEICFKIMFDDMPYVDRVLQLCLDIYLVREAREFYLEEDLFAKLVFLFRSPETLIKWTRPVEEVDDENDLEEEDGN